MNWHPSTASLIDRLGVSVDFRELNEKVGGPLRGTYKHFRPISGSNLGRPYTNKGSDMVDEQPSPLFNQFAKFPAEARLIRERSDYFLVRPRFQNVMYNVLKCDAPAIEPSNPTYSAAIKAAITYFAYINSSVAEPTDTWEINMTASSGQPWLYQGLKKKQDVISNASEKLFHLANTPTIPLCTTNDKKERLPFEDFYRVDQEHTSKVRMTYCPPFHFLLSQKIFFDRQNAAMLLNSTTKWVKYGISKENGGFDNVIKPLDIFDMLEMADVSGWDRNAFLRAVYLIRSANLTVPDELKDLFDWIVEFTIHPVVILPNGDIVQLETGDISGQNNTTPDNSILHVLVLIYLYMRLLVRAGKLPSLWTILSNAIYAIFSDDKLGGCYKDAFGIKSVEDFKQMQIQVYSEFGFKLKPRAVLVMDHVPGERVPANFEFLGSQVGYDTKYCRYVPLPRVGKICSSILYGPETRLNDRDYFARLLDLAVLLHPLKEYWDAAFKFLLFFKQMRPLDAPYYEHLLETKCLKDPLYDLPISLYGFESGSFQIFTRRVSDLLIFERGGNKMQTAGVVRTYNADKIIDSWVASKENSLTRNGSLWFRHAINPFYDTEATKPRGWPDANSDPSIVQAIPSTKTLDAAAFGITSGTNWNFKVRVHPTDSVIDMFSPTARGGNLFVTDAASGTQPVSNEKMGAIELIGETSDLSTSNSIFITMPSDDSTQGLGRLVGLAYEVIDVSAELYRTGTLTAYRMPANEGNNGVLMLANNPTEAANSLNFGVNQYQAFRRHPDQPAEAIKYRGSVQWKNAEGIYQVVKMSSSYNPAKQPCSTMLVLLGEDEQIGETTTVGTTALERPAGNFLMNLGSSLDYNVQSYQSKRIFPIHQCGCFMSGMSREFGSVTVRVRWIYESFPSVDESTLLNIASPSTGYDSAAMELYDYAMRNLPVAVKVAENDSGQWLWDLVKKVSAIASPVLHAIPHPLAQIAATAADNVQKTAKQKVVKKKAKAKAAPRPAVRPK